MRRKITSNLVAFILTAGSNVYAASLPSYAAQAKTSTKPGTAPRKARIKKPFQVGPASWYGKRFHGRTTASGEPFNMYQLTAAHRTLPMGSWVKVTNLRNHRWILVRVNDRGPVPQNRIIDLSYTAAQMLDMRAQGIAQVRLDLVNKNTAADETIALLQNNSLF